MLAGCQVDADCGLGQACLREPTAPATATGICISKQAYDDDFETMRSLCAPFIANPCGRPLREYVITRAFQDRLYLAPRKIPATAHARPVFNEDGSLMGVTELEDSYTCRLPLAPTQATDDSGALVGCTDDEQCRSLSGNDDTTVCDDDGACRSACPDGIPSCYECGDDTDCTDWGEGAICSDGQCRRPCQGKADCTLSPLPGPRCFAELVGYEVRLRNSFVVRDGGSNGRGFLTDWVYADPETGECRVDQTVSNLLSSRLWLGADEEQTWNDPRWGIPDCPGADVASPLDPNPCRVTRRREDDPASLFHRFAYQGQDVEAIRFSNPYASFELDLTSLLDLASTPNGVAGVLCTGQDTQGCAWPPEFAAFRRARIPRGYVQDFNVPSQIGYVPFNEIVVVQSTPLVYPVRIVPAPEPGFAFIVDAGGRGGVQGVRGQVVRVNAAGVDSGEIADTTFKVR